MADELELSLLGTPQVIHDGTRVTGFAYQKSLALLAYLAVTGHYHAREALAGLFWGEATGPNARANLRKVLADLRRKVPSHLSISRHEVAFNRGALYRLDVEAFDGHISQAIGRSHNPLTEEGAAALTQAVTLYRGDFMEGFQVLHAAAFEEWVSQEQEWLRQLALQALRTLASYHAAQGTYDRSIGCLERMLMLEPAEEEAHRAMMILHAFCGRRAAALRQYTYCCQALAELGADPLEETRVLYERIRDGTWHSGPSDRRDRDFDLGLFFPSSWSIM